VVQGGCTGLVGGSVPAGGEVVLSMRRLAMTGPVREEPGGASVVVGAGATLAAVQSAVRPVGWDVAVDLAARDSATVGGMVATDAGGEHVIRYGSMREQVLGLRATLADGSEVGSSDRSAAHRRHGVEDLLVGSEGTLGVVTEVRLRLVPLAGRRAVAVVAVDSVHGALDVLTSLRGMASAGNLPAPLSAAELMLADGMALVRAATGLPAPVAGDPPAYLLVELAEDAAAGAGTQPGALVPSLAEALGGLDGVRDATLADDAAGIARLWRYREAHTEAIARAGRPVKLDVSVPAEALPGFVAGLDGLVADAASSVDGTATPRVVVFGHLGVQNLHVNVLGVDAVPAATHAVTDAVLRAVADLGGSISAEHGVGRAKVAWLALTRSQPDLAAMQATKRALDPTWMLGPGVLLPPPAPPDPHTGRS
jgi:FAD/FMN-containing dehydrogenase